MTGRAYDDSFDIGPLVSAVRFKRLFKLMRSTPSYSGECPQLCTPSATGWPSGESLRLAAAGCSQCHHGHRSRPSSLPTKTKRRKESMRGSEGGARPLYWHEERGSVRRPRSLSALPVLPVAHLQSPPQRG